MLYCNAIFPVYIMLSLYLFDLYGVVPFLVLVFPQEQTEPFFVEGEVNNKLVAAIFLQVTFVVVVCR